MPYPPSTLLRALENSRLGGSKFEIAWPPALADALDGQLKSDRQLWRKAFTDTRGAWQRAYDREDVEGREAAPAAV
jgi:hypothetical protein